MIYDLVPNRVFLTDACDEANRPQCKNRGTPHVHIGCGSPNNWSIESVAALSTTLKALQASGLVTQQEREVAEIKLCKRDGAGLLQLAKAETPSDLAFYDHALFLRGQDPLSRGYKDLAATVIRAAFFCTAGW